MKTLKITLLAIFTISTINGTTINYAKCKSSKPQLLEAILHTRQAMNTMDIHMVKYYSLKALENLALSEITLKECKHNCMLELEKATSALQQIANISDLTENKKILGQATVLLSKTLKSIGNHPTTKPIIDTESAILTTSSRESRINKVVKKLEHTINEKITNSSHFNTKIYLTNLHDTFTKALENPSLSHSKMYYYAQSKKIVANALQQLSITSASNNNFHY